MTSCSHDWERQDRPLAVAFTIDSWQGATDAIVRCAGCGAYALLRLLHWSGRNLSTRIFAVSGLNNPAVTVFLRNMKSDYCDLERHRAEVEALTSTAGPVSRVVVTRMPEMHVTASLEPSGIGAFSIASWRSRPPREDDPLWQGVLAANP